VVVSREGKESRRQCVDLGVKACALNECASRHLICEYRKKFGCQIGRNDEKAVFFGLLGNKVVYLIGEADENVAGFKMNFLRVGVTDGLSIKDLNDFYVI
jgi:extradiol dioxygenase family protein